MGFLPLACYIPFGGVSDGSIQKDTPPLLYLARQV